MKNINDGKLVLANLCNFGILSSYPLLLLPTHSSLTFQSFCMVRALYYYSHQQSEFVTNQGYQLGVDVGGTFTDVYVFTPHGQIVRAKVPPTIPDQSIGIHNGITKARENLKPQFNWSGKFQFIHHGTTIATNAVLEGKGACTAVVVIAGHKDILALRRSQIPGGLGAWLDFTPPEPIVPLERVVQCKERMSVQGEPVTAVDIEDLRRSLRALAGQNPEAFAISLLNSHSNDSYERVVEGIVREELGSDVAVICSADVLREVGEYERTVTTCTNAPVKPVV